MNPSTRTSLFGALAFLGAGAASFFLGGAVGGGETPAAALPVYEAPAPLVIPIAVPDEEDFTEFAATVLTDIEGSREAASAAGTPSVFGGGSVVEIAAIPGSAAATDPTPDTTAPSATDPPAVDGTAPSGAPPETDPPAAAAAAEDRAVDICTVEDAADCPDGVGGTILLAVRDIPLVGFAAMEPPVPGEGADWGRAICPGDAHQEGRLLLGVATSRPVSINVRYRAGRWTGSAYEVQGEFDVVTDATAEGPWNAWVADETLPTTDPTAWVQHCIVMPDLPPRADYLAFIEITDKYAPGPTVAVFPRQLRFVVTNDGLVPGEQRRPTFLLGYGIDDLRVGVTSTPEQDVVMAAVPDTTPGVCDTGGVDRSVIDRSDAIAGRVISDTAIDPAVLADPGYPYFVEHSRSIVSRVGLQEGTDYTLCIYWFAPGPSFDARVIEISEAVVVGTPEAYRPRLTLVDATNLYGDLTRIAVKVPGCPTVSFTEMATGRSGSPDWIGAPTELCTLETGLTDFDRGIRLITGVGLADGTGAEHRPFIRTGLECDSAPCRIRLDELAVVPLPLIPAEGGCGSGFGTGCLSTDDPRRSAGDLAIRIEYLDVPGNGRAEWSIGDAAEFADTPATLPEIPRVDVDVSYELRSNDPGFGATANVIVTADRPVSLRMEATQLEPVCGVFGAPAYENPGLAMVHTFSLDTLCLGTPYRLLVTGQDGSGTDLVVVPERSFGDIAPYADIAVPPVWANLEMSASISVPSDSNRYLIELTPVRIQPRTVIPPYGNDLEWSMSAEDRAGAQRAGWNVLGRYDQITACGLAPGAGDLTFSTVYDPGSLVGQEDVLVTINAIIYRLHPVGGIYGECARDVAVNTVRIQQSVTIADLREGVTLMSDSGSVSVTLRMTRWRSELIG